MCSAPVVNDDGTICRCFQPGEYCPPNCKRRQKQLDEMHGIPTVTNTPAMPSIKPPKSEDNYTCSENDKRYTVTANGDPINHPFHYKASNAHCGYCKTKIECIDITRHYSFNLGNAIKYIWRADHKNNSIEDLKKAVWYLTDEIKRRDSKMP